MIQKLLGPTVPQILIGLGYGPLGYEIIGLDRIAYRPTSLHKYSARKKLAGGYFRGKIFSREQ